MGPYKFEASTNFSRSSKLFMMASLIVGSSAARCAAATVTRTATRALSTSAALKKDEKMMETIDHAVGPEKYELLAKQQGNDDPFFLRVINRADFKGTKEDPIIVNALDSYRMIGCQC